MFEMKKLPYEADALEPYVSMNTLSFHYGKHYANYVNTLNKLIEGTEFENMDLETIIKKTNDNIEYAAIFNNAAQVWNHEFLWQSMSPNGNEPKDELMNKIVEEFGSYEEFKLKLKEAAISVFGSGWVWVCEKDGKIEIIKTINAKTPVSEGIKTLLCIDVWEHAYYLDYQNRRVEHVENFINHLLNWQ